MNFKCFLVFQVNVKVTQSCLTLCDPVDCSLPGSSVHRILQARILEWVALREPIPRQIDKKSGVPEDEKGVWGSQRGGKDKHFYFSSTFVSLSHIKRSFL